MSQKMLEISKDYQYEEDIDISKAVVSFSEFFGKKTAKDIYTGFEELPFRKKHPIFRSLLMIEFEDAMRDFNTNQNKI